MRNTRLFHIFLIFAVVASAPIGFSQTLPPPPLLTEEDKEILQIESRLVIMPVSVTDGNGSPVKGLSTDNFSVKENTRSQEINKVSAAEKVPLEIALLFDVSASVDPTFEFEQHAAAKFLAKVMRPEDRATIFTIGKKPVLLQTRNISTRAIETIKKIKPSKDHLLLAYYGSSMCVRICNP